MDVPIMEVPSPTEVVSDMEAEDDDKADAETVPGQVGDVQDVPMVVKKEEVNESLPPPGLEGEAPPGGGVGPVPLASRPRKRERAVPGNRAGGSEHGQDEEESPSKRPHDGGDDAPVSGRELRYLLNQHMIEFREAWK